MPTIPAHMSAAIASGCTQFADCVRIVRKDATEFGFTTHVEDLIISGLDYKSSAAFTGSDLSTKAGLSADNIDLNGFFAAIAADGITEDDVRAGLYDDAEIWFFTVDYTDPAAGMIKRAHGNVGQITTNENGFAVEILTDVQRLQQLTGELASKTCRADHGDARCGFNLATVTVTGTITSVTDARVFADSARTEADDHFTHGVLTWTTGNNNGLSMEVMGYTGTGGVFALFQPMPYEVQVGDTYSVPEGCDKLFVTCRDDFNNVVNFRGEPYIPNENILSDYGNRG